MTPIIKSFSSASLHSSVVILLVTIMSSMFIEVCIVSDSKVKRREMTVIHCQMVKRQEQGKVNLSSIFALVKRRQSETEEASNECWNLFICFFLVLPFLPATLFVFSRPIVFRMRKAKICCNGKLITTLMGEKTERIERQYEISEAKSVFLFAMNLLFRGTDNCVVCWLLWKWEKWTN